MVGRPQVSIRLGTIGRSDVERDFAAIGDAGDAQAKRYQAAWDRASAEVTGALEKQAKAAARLQAVGATPVQQRINASTGVGQVSTGNAKAAAAALAAELDRAEAEARQLIASIDPLFAAQSRYEAQVARINAVRSTGQLSEERYLQLLANEKSLLDQASAAGQRNAGISGQRRMGMQQLGFQMNDVASQMAMGTKASVIFAQQSAQTVQALQLMGGEGNKFLNFLKGPWGIALSVAVVALSPLISKLFETGNAVDDLVEKEKKEAKQSADTDRAHQIFANTLDGVSKALRDNAKALHALDDAGKSAARRALEVALAEAEKTTRIREATVAILQQQEANLKNAQAVSFGAGGGASAYGAQSFFQQQVDAAHAAVEEAKRDAGEAQRQIADATSRLVVEVATRDPVERIKKHYADLIESTRKRLLAEHATTEEIIRQTRALQDQSDAAVKAEQAKDRKGPANAGGAAIFNEQIASFFDEANKFRGLGEKAGADKLLAFMHEGQVSIDSLSTKWCAAFVNAVLAKMGVIGTKSLAASSFLNFGKDDTHSPQRGDVAVVQTKVGQHVGFVDSVDKAGNVRVLGGNTSDKVAEATYSKNQVLAIRRPPTPSESATAADKAASDALQQQAAFDSERERLNQQLLVALQKTAGGAEESAAIQQQRVQDEHDAEATAIATNLAAGKYGDATDKLAQARAKELTDANAAALKARQAAIAQDSLVKSYQAQDDANERAAKYQVEDLQFAESHARTAAERRRLQLEIIDVEYKEKEEHLRYLLVLAQLTGNTKAAAEAAAELARLPTDKAHDQRGANDNTKSPFEAYRDSLPKDWKEAGEVMQQDVVGALNQLNEGLADALMKSKNFHDLWKNMKSVIHDFAATLLKDLIEMTIKMMIIKPLMNLITGGSAAGVPAFATGTEYFSGGTAWVGEHGPELVRLPRGSKVHTAADSARMAAANDTGTGLSLVVNNDFRGAAPEAVGALMERVDQMERNLQTTIVSTMSEARSRHLWREGRRG